MNVAFHRVTALLLAGLMHLRIARLLLILRRARRADDRGVHDGAAPELHAAGLQHPTDFGKQMLAQFVRLKQAPEFEQRRRVRYGFTAQVNPDKATQADAVVQRFFAGKVRRIEPVLNEVDAQHALQTNRQAAVAPLRKMRFDHRAQLSPRRNCVHTRARWRWSEAS